MKESVNENGDHWWNTNKILHIYSISNNSSNKPLYKLTKISEQLT